MMIRNDDKESMNRRKKSMKRRPLLSILLAVLAAAALCYAAYRYREQLRAGYVKLMNLLGRLAGQICLFFDRLRSAATAGAAAACCGDEIDDYEMF